MSIQEFKQASSDAEDLVSSIVSLESLRQLSYFDTLSLLGEFSLHCGGVTNTAEMLYQAGVTGSSKILEIGCGTGSTTRSLLEIGLNLTVVEPSLRLIKAAQSNCSLAISAKASWHHCSAEKMSDISSGSQDIVLLECVFGFISDKERAVSEIIRVLANNGKIIITDFYYRQVPCDSILDELERILHIQEILMEESWGKYFNKMSCVYKKFIPCGKTNIDLDFIIRQLKKFGKYDSFPFGEEGMVIVFEKIKNWDRFFSENRRLLQGVNLIYKKL